MTLRIGVIGVGMIGQDHIRRLTEVLAGSAVVAVSDVDPDRARKVAATLSACTTHPTGLELIADPTVDAVVVTSWGPTHEEFVLAAIEAGKPVFCEKPLATTREACERIMKAETTAGQRLVQVGFMRRFDRSYRSLKEVVDSAQLGAPLMMHCAHRIPEVPPHYTAEMAINEAVIHEIDLVRWLFDDEITAVQVLTPRRNGNAKNDLADPLFVLIELGSGTLVDVEVSCNVRYGYDIRGEVVCENGTVSLAETTEIVLKHNARYSGQVAADWRERFIGAYDVELQEWIDNLAANKPPAGPTSWDGYAATAAAEAAIEAMNAGQRTAVLSIKKPDFYRS
jgi:myo-inositol 2-dehydrogenase/D-chiro-inositol 1-dehydrogenase